MQILYDFEIQIILLKVKVSILVIVLEDLAIFVLAQVKMNFCANMRFIVGNYFAL